MHLGCSATSAYRVPRILAPVFKAAPQRDAYPLLFDQSHWQLSLLLVLQMAELLNAGKPVPMEDAEVGQTFTG